MSLEREKGNVLRKTDLNLANVLDLVKVIKEAILVVKLLPTAQSHEVSQTVPTIGQTQRSRIIICFTD